MKIQKTNAARLLDKEKIEYTLVPYQVDEEHLDAIHVARQLGEDISMVFKTLVLKGDRTGHFVCVIPGDKEVDLKMAAKASGNKSCNLIHMKELLTGEDVCQRRSQGPPDLHRPIRPHPCGQGYHLPAFPEPVRCVTYLRPVAQDS